MPWQQALTVCVCVGGEKQEKTVRGGEEMGGNEE